METVGDDESLKGILSLLKERLPLDFSEYKPSTILRRIKRRAGHLDFHQLSEYLNYLTITTGEAEALSREFLISVTSFFRDVRAFEVLERRALPEILAGLAPDEELKMWVAGCATGEEAYSLAILVAEQLGEGLGSVIVKIFATDIDRVALEIAARGTYPIRIEKDIAPARLEKCFSRQGEGYVIKPEIRKMILFAYHDLTKNPPYCNMRLISCRNLLIYMTPVLQQKVFDTLLFGLKKEGYLFLGTSENPLPISASLEKIDEKWRVYRKQNHFSAVRFDAFYLPELAKSRTLPYMAGGEGAQQGTLESLTEEGSEKLAARLNSLILYIDEDKNVVKAYGNTGQFLLSKNFKQNLEDLLPYPLLIALTSLVSQALKTNKEVQANRIAVPVAEFSRVVNISVSPLTESHRGRRMMLLTFMNDLSQDTAGPMTDEYNEKTLHDELTSDLELEVKQLKQKLSDAYVRLDANNENIQSFHEELLSANEEMQSANKEMQSVNEEMQSVNEEMHTVNSDYQLKNRELLELNDDLNNYFRSNVNGQLFVNTHLELVRFSPGTVKQINLLPSDIGRPLSDISTNLKLENIEGDIKSVLAEGGIITKELQTNSGQWYQIMTMPYIRQADNKTDGAVITFNDITELKSVQKELDTKVNALVRINADLDTFIHTASHDLLAPLGNIESSIEAINTMTLTDIQKNQLLKIIDTSIKKFRSLIKDIGTIAKIEGDMANQEMVDLHEILNNIEWSLQDKIKSSNASITRTLEINTVQFSKKNLRSILYNLVSNGLKFSDGLDPDIEISSFKEGKTVLLSVQDHGLGIEESQLSKIFDLYGRLHEEIEGQGVGLFLARKLVNAAGGTLTVESKVGKGSKFQITLNS